MSAQAPEGGLVDVHAHFLPDGYVEEARAHGHLHPDGMPDWPAWNAAAQLADMDRRGIRKAILSVSSPGVHFGDPAAAAALASSVNDQAAALVKSHPGRFGFFASLPLPDVDAAVVEFRRAAGELGADGVVLESHAHGQYPGDPALEPLWKEIEDRRRVVLVHPTSPVEWYSVALGRPRPMLEFMFDTTRAIVDLGFSGVLTRHPGLSVIVPHCGAALPVLGDRIALFQQAFGDGAGEPWPRIMRRLWFDTAGTPFPTALPALTATAGTDHILYGSDSCWTPAAVVDAVLASIDDAPPPAGAPGWRRLTTDNAARLFS